MDSEVTIELTYLLVEVDGEEVLCIDKLNHVYRIDGEDQLAEINALI